MATAPAKRGRLYRPDVAAGQTTNIYETLVSRNVFDQTYTVDELGNAISLNPQGRLIQTGLIRSGAPELGMRQPKVPLDRTAAPGDPQAGYTVGG